jgi:NodT family efflux transporter outer membrane factor (OMF) lipoprotein
MKRNFLIVLVAFAFFSSCKVLNYKSVVSDLSLSETIFVDSTQGEFVLLDYKSFYKDKFLQQLIDSALTKNFDYLMVLQRIEIVKSGFNHVKMNRLPTLDVAGGLGGRKYSDYTMDGVGLFDQNLSPNVTGDFITPAPIVPDYHFGFMTSWEIDFWGKLKQLKDAEKNKFLASVQAERALKSMLVNEIAKTYYLLLAYDEELRIAENNLALQQKALEMVTFQKQGGMANELAVTQVKAQVLNTQSLYLLISQRIIETENQLNNLLGRFPQSVARATEFQTESIAIATDEKLSSQLLLNRPDIMQAAFVLESSKANLEATKKSFLPSFSLSGTMGLQAYRSALFLAFPEASAINLLGGLSQPVWNRNFLKSNFNIKKAEQLTALYEFEKGIINGCIEVSNNLNKVNILNQFLKIKQDEVNTLISSVEISNDLFSSGLSNYLEVINAQRNVLFEEINFVYMKLEEVHAKISLYQALGGGVN